MYDWPKTWHQNHTCQSIPRSPLVLHGKSLEFEYIECLKFPKHSGFEYISVPLGSCEVKTWSPGHARWADRPIGTRQVKMWSAKQQNSNAECKGAKMCQAYRHNITELLLMFVAASFGCPATEEKRVAKKLGNVATPAQKEYPVQESLHESNEFRRKRTELFNYGKVALNDRMGLPWTVQQQFCLLQISTPQLWQATNSRQRSHFSPVTSQIAQAFTSLLRSSTPLL